MKHTPYQSTRAKNNLITWTDLQSCDFYQEEGIWYLNCQDNVGVSAFDYWKNLILEQNEE